MDQRTIQRPSPTQPLHRQALIALLESALQVKEYSYARQTALGWLAFFPGDLPVTLLYAQALMGQGLSEQAFTAVEKILLVDPEYIDAQTWLASMMRALNRNCEQIEACLYILTGNATGSEEFSSWVHTLHQRYEWLQRQDRPLALWELPTTAQLDDDGEITHSPSCLQEQGLASLARIIQARVLLAHHDDSEYLIQYAESYLERWPSCVTMKLIVADAIMAKNPEKAVALLHESVALDTTGQTTNRLWGSDHPYKRLWPAALEVSPGHATSPQAIPIPAGLAAYMSWNQLPQPLHTLTTQDSPKFTPSIEPEVPKICAPLPQTPLSLPVKPVVQHNLRIKYPEIPTLKQAAAKIKQPGLGRVDGRYPVYVIFSTLKGLNAQYGESGARQIRQELDRLCETISRYRQWGALVFLADAPDFGPYRTKLNLVAADPADPWALKLALVDLDAGLALSGEMIGAVLVVGGPEVVPFHRLPNPVDDSDSEVVSDNPYSTRDENYFVPEWSVGRLPGDCGNDPETLLRMVRQVTAYHLGFVKEKFWLIRWIERLRTSLDHLAGSAAQKRTSFGYSAAAWRRAALSVFRPIGEPRRLMVCPPVQVSETCALHNPNKTCLSLPAGKLAYFNLHGLVDTDEWYGQRDPFETQDGPDFPLALRAADIGAAGQNDTKTPQVVFSEACYGAHIIDKSVNQAISLKLLSAGSRAVVGSTCISYGSISSPLIAADLLGHSFWHYLKEGQPAGEALRRAKIHLAREMHQRQGYLDGEDQKTLLSFVLYGDPLVQISDLQRGPKNTMRPSQRANPVRIICDREETSEHLASVPSQVMAQVKQIVKVYLPGMKDAQVHLSQERANCQGHGHACPAATLHMKSAGSTSLQGRQVVTLSKTIQEDSLNHAQYARLTLDASGKLIKLVVSR